MQGLTIQAAIVAMKMNIDVLSFLLPIYILSVLYIVLSCPAGQMSSPDVAGSPRNVVSRSAATAVAQRPALTAARFLTRVCRRAAAVVAAKSSDQRPGRTMIPRGPIVLSKKGLYSSCTKPRLYNVTAA